ncbi:MAG: CO dehydrogenase/acetyl-CoA synthase complex subunit epsilon [Nitrososphaerales archaeon]|nr:CO dehydrogenase/acetyl-CoA synthase complex subunit epsilon [Nitrososphaerales archaeon]
MSADPWQTAEIPGPMKALIITKPVIVSGMLKKAKRAIMVVGHEAAEIDFGGERAIDYAIRMAKALQIPVVATAHIAGEFVKRGCDQVWWMPAVDIGNRLQDPDWQGLDGKGQYDLAIFMGITYYMEWTILSGLKHLALHLKTVSLDRHYQPHAFWSFPNISLEEWQKNLKEILNQLEKRL